ncbi:hypothetical protein HK097_003574 [Rhizophlyctis rosea]|uniref:Uncharacterized protein n=1 Tax=Rhizophlyctis rosea TaxID=64517 RepID=A0AAD5S399_9FUNG|nr:hypothetical protein HK097_003574 [Rhizophlyctis rosea]
MLCGNETWRDLACIHYAWLRPFTLELREGEYTRVAADDVSALMGKAYRAKPEDRYNKREGQTRYNWRQTDAATENGDIYDQSNNLVVKNIKHCNPGLWSSGSGRTFTRICSDTCLIYDLDNPDETRIQAIDLAAVGRNSDPVDAALDLPQSYLSITHSNNTEIDREYEFSDFNETVLVVLWSLPREFDDDYDYAENPSLYGYAFQVYCIKSWQLIGEREFDCWDSRLEKIIVTRTNILCFEDGDSADDPNKPTVIHILDFKGANLLHSVDIHASFGSGHRYSLQEFLDGCMALRSINCRAKPPRPGKAQLHFLDPKLRTCIFLRMPPGWSNAAESGGLIVPEHELDGEGVRVCGLGRRRVDLTCYPNCVCDVSVWGGDPFIQWRQMKLEEWGFE